MIRPSTRGQLAWQNSALCLEATSTADRLFFPMGRPTHAVKKMCALCPVRGDCLSYALGAELEGIWGGTTDRERKEMRDAHAG